MSGRANWRSRVSIAGSIWICWTVVWVGCANAQESPPPSRGGWYAGIASGWYFPIQKWGSSYWLGGGGVLILGYQFDPSLSLRLEANQWLLSGDGNNTWDIKITPEIKWDLGSHKLRPFVWAGAGADYQRNYPGGTSTVTLVIPVGLGVQWDLSSRCRLFVEASYNILVNRVSTQDVPLVGGFEVHF